MNTIKELVNPEIFIKNYEIMGGGALKAKGRNRSISHPKFKTKMAI